MAEWFVYMVRTRGGALYTGVTRDVQRRFAEHQGGGPKSAKALRGRGPLVLELHCAMGSKSQALKVEAAIKKWKKLEKEALIRNGAPMLLAKFSGALDLTVQR